MAALEPAMVGELILPGLAPIPVLHVPLAVTPSGVVGRNYQLTVSADTPRLTPEAAMAMRRLLETFPAEEQP